MSPTRSHATRFLHFALLAIVLHQLFSSLWAERPLPGEPMGWPYFLHERIGLAGFCLLFIFWIWIIVRSRPEPRLGVLFPWFSAPRRAALLADLVKLARALTAFRLPPLELDALAGATHGLGLVVASWMAVTGAAWFLALGGGHFGRLVIDLHQLCGNLMWAYLIGHALAAIMHQWAGDEIFSRMFWVRRRAAASSE